MSREGGKGSMTYYLKVLKEREKKAEIRLYEIQNRIKKEELKKEARKA